MAARHAATAILLAFSIGCSGSPTQPSPLPIGKPFELRMGAGATLDGDLRVIFLDVLSDSRCPMDAICVAAGQAIVVIGFAERSNPITSPTLSIRLVISGQIVTDNGPITPPVCDPFGSRIDCYLSTAEGQTTATTDRYTITLRQLAPHPRAASAIQPKDYVATLVVSAR